MLKVLITGNGGYVASSLYKSLKHTYDVTAIGRSDFDLSNSYLTKKWFENKTFDVVVHAAIVGGHREVAETSSVLDCNLKMYYNLLDNKSNYVRLINIGSGAEIFDTHTPYGFSKHVIRTSILDKDNFYNLRVFGLFNENELDTRFIKSNVLRYIRHQDLIIHQDKKMDFFYMEDFISVVQHYITQSNPPKEIDCKYDISYNLSEIAARINTLADYSMGVHTSDTRSRGIDYIGTYTDIGILYKGLDNGIQNVYQNLLCNI